ncbi:hypothetical protein AHAS_Ahas13G0471800 [Arachis hypogaea]
MMMAVTIAAGHLFGPNFQASASSLEDWIKDNASSKSEAEKATLMLVVQLRDPLRCYEAVGGPMLVVVHATHAEEKEEEEEKFKLSSMYVGSFKAAKKGKQALQKGKDLLWTISSRIVADMWLKTMRNPDIKLLK